MCNARAGPPASSRPSSNGHPPRRAALAPVRTVVEDGAAADSHMFEHRLEQYRAGLVLREPAGRPVESRPPVKDRRGGECEVAHVHMRWALWVGGEAVRLPT